jgi:hypothetical protein
MSIEWDSVRVMALDCLNSSLDLLNWAERSQQEDYEIDSATQHLAAIAKARDTFFRSLKILPSGLVAHATDPPRQFPIFDKLAQASAHVSDRPDFMFSSTAHEAVFRLLGMALLHIENNLNDDLAIEDLHRFSPEQLRKTLYLLENKDPLKSVLGGYARLQNLQAWIHREWAAVSQLPLARDCGDVEQPQEPISPKELLASWLEILIALGLRNNPEDKQKVARLNEVYNGPIKKPGQGKQPFADKVKLLDWWNGLEKLVESQADRARDARMTVQDTHAYGLDGEVVPEISGQVKKRRKDRQP